LKGTKRENQVTPAGFWLYIAHGDFAMIETEGFAECFDEANHAELRGQNRFDFRLPTSDFPLRPSALIDGSPHKASANLTFERLQR
jgi:hypothetical protein